MRHNLIALLSLLVISCAVSRNASGQKPTKNNLWCTNLLNVDKGIVDAHLKLRLPQASYDFIQSTVKSGKSVVVFFQDEGFMGDYSIQVAEKYNFAYTEDDSSTTGKFRQNWADSMIYYAAGASPERLVLFPMSYHDFKNYTAGYKSILDDDCIQIVGTSAVMSFNKDQGVTRLGNNAINAFAFRKDPIDSVTPPSRDDSAPVPPEPTPKSVFVDCRMTAPYPNGPVYYVGTVTMPRRTIAEIKNPNLGFLKQWGIKIVRPGFSTQDCNRSDAVIALLPGQSTDFFAGRDATNFVFSFCIGGADEATRQANPPPAWTVEVTLK